ncbi:unnamed protein product [Caenorhabditis auriculariae]|uniref:UBA domain-containing protein n=1 Tax=Caenorhabditis auriculariae TaxID=2777116 RepID=A0A8S1H4V0_9PELO|nr:unnamed protein product [Caenorhabditis auriculariae]
MVQVFFNGGSHSFNLADIQTISPDQLISKVVDVSSGRYGLSHHGKLVREMPTLHEKAALRIVPLSAEKDQPAADHPTLTPERVREHRLAIGHKLKHLFSERGYTHFKKIRDTMDASGYFQKLLKDCPELREEPFALNLLSDYTIMTSFFEPNTDVNKVEKVISFLMNHPKLLAYLDRLLQQQPPKIRSQNQMPRFAPASRGPQALNQITPELLRDAMSFVLGGAALPAAPPPVQNVAPPPAPAVPEYSAQLAQLRELGFTNDEYSLLALQSTSGDVDAAIECIIAMMEE